MHCKEENTEIAHTSGREEDFCVYIMWQDLRRQIWIEETFDEIPHAGLCEVDFCLHTLWQDVHRQWRLEETLEEIPQGEPS